MKVAIYSRGGQTIQQQDLLLVLEALKKAGIEAVVYKEIMEQFREGILAANHPLPPVSKVRRIWMTLLMRFSLWGVMAPCWTPYVLCATAEYRYWGSIMGDWVFWPALARKKSMRQ